MSNGRRSKDSGRARAADHLERLSTRPLDLVSLWQEASAVLADTVPHYWAPCWFTLDPHTLLITSHFQDGIAEVPEEWLRAEYVAADAQQVLSVALSQAGLSTLHEATGGDPSSSPRWQANRELGADQELLLRLATADGETWAVAGLYREPDRPLFDEDEKAFLRSVAPHLARGARRALVMGEALDPEWPDAPGLLVVDGEGRTVRSTAAAARWLELLGAGDGAVLPTAVLSVVGAARADPARAEARVRTEEGAWVTVRGSAFADSDEVAVLVEPTRPGRVLDLLMSAHQLTPREREVVEHVLAGETTAQMAAALHLSAYTVQEHLVSVFDKMGVRSRRELVAQAFFHHYAPRFRDNERRAVGGRPLRGGPAAPPG